MTNLPLFDGPTLFICLPVDRRSAGQITLIRGRRVSGRWRCLGKADNARAIRAGNRERDPTLPYGDFPTGTYEVTGYVAFETPHPRIGNGWLPLDGALGQARDAKQGGRTGLGIHAGRGDDELRPTYGCLRMLDRDFAAMVDAISDDPVLVMAVEELPA